jgi:hypothetical protein
VEYEREARTEQAIVAASEEQGVTQTLFGDQVAVSVRDSADEATEPKAAKVVGDRTRRRATAAERFEPLSQIAVRKAVG